MYDTSLVNKILKRSDAALQLQYFQEVMKEEAKRRKDFYNWRNYYSFSCQKAALG